MDRRVDIDFPDPLPISEGELALIEVYFSAIIATLSDEAPPSSPSPTAE